MLRLVLTFLIFLSKFGFTSADQISELFFFLFLESSNIASSFVKDFLPSNPLHRVTPELFATQFHLFSVNLSSGLSSSRISPDCFTWVEFSFFLFPISSYLCGICPRVTPPPPPLAYLLFCTTDLSNKTQEGGKVCEKCHVDPWSARAFHLFLEWSKTAEPSCCLCVLCALFYISTQRNTLQYWPKSELRIFVRVKLRTHRAC